MADRDAGRSGSPFAPLCVQLEALFVLLVSVMTVAFFIDFFISPPSVSDVAEGFSFEAEPYARVPALGLIGAVIMPHNIYLHSALVLSRVVDRTNTRKLWEVSQYISTSVGFSSTCIASMYAGFSGEGGREGGTCVAGWNTGCLQIKSRG